MLFQSPRSFRHKMETMIYKDMPILLLIQVLHAIEDDTHAVYTHGRKQ